MTRYFARTIESSRSELFAGDTDLGSRKTGMDKSVCVATPRGGETKPTTEGGEKVAAKEEREERIERVLGNRLRSMQFSQGSIKKLAAISGCLNKAIVGANPWYCLFRPEDSPLAAAPPPPPPLSSIARFYLRI